MKARKRCSLQMVLHALGKARHAGGALARDAAHAIGMRSCGKA
jgi:hypothetical protein